MKDALSDAKATASSSVGGAETSPAGGRKKRRVGMARVIERETGARERDALIRRLKDAAAAADAGRTIDITGLSDEAFIALLRRG